MANNITAFRLPPAEKHALKVLAAEADMSLTTYILDVLRRNTELTLRAKKLAPDVLDIGQNDNSSEMIHINRVYGERKTNQSSEPA